MRKQHPLAFLIVFMLSMLVVPEVSAQKPNPQQNPPAMTPDRAVSELNGATNQVNDASGHLAANAAKAADISKGGTFDKWDAAVKKVEENRKKAKDSADAAKKAADEALAAAKNCDKKAYKAARDKATSEAENAKNSARYADDAEKGLESGMDQLNNQLSDANKAANKALGDANLLENPPASAVADLERAQQKLQKALDNKDTATNLSRYRSAVRGLKDRLKDADETKADAAKNRTDALDEIKEADKLIKDCPPPNKEGAMVPKQATEIYVAMDTRCGTNVDLCNLEGQDSRPIADSLGMQDCGAIATTATDAVYHCPGDPSRADTISTRAQEKNICVGFAERNYCEGGAPFNSERSKFVNPEPLIIQLRRARR